MPSTSENGEFMYLLKRGDHAAGEQQVVDAQCGQDVRDPAVL